ncbi:MAG: hypothetical protein VYE73_11125 [Acidobacteriota bacterium]|nr:hypothetical protein [Acidobacteriota bacterium]
MPLVRQRYEERAYDRVRFLPLSGEEFALSSALAPLLVSVLVWLLSPLRRSSAWRGLAMFALLPPAVLAATLIELALLGFATGVWREIVVLMLTVEVFAGVLVGGLLLGARRLLRRGD